MMTITYIVNPNFHSAYLRTPSDTVTEISSSNTIIDLTGDGKDDPAGRPEAITFLNNTSASPSIMSSPISFVFSDDQDGLVGTSRLPSEADVPADRAITDGYMEE